MDTDQDTADQQAALRTTKELFIAVAEAIDKFREPLQDLLKLHELMKLALTQQRAATDPVFAKFLHEDFAPGIAKRLCKKRPIDEKVSPLC